MRRKLTTLRAKGGESQNGAPRQLIDEAVLREHLNFVNGVGEPPHWDTSYSGWSNSSRPKDSSISLRTVFPAGGPPPPIIT